MPSSEQRSKKSAIRDSWEITSSTSIAENSEAAAAFYRRVFFESPVAMLVAEPGLLVIDANAAAQQLLKRPIVALRGKPFLLQIASEDRHEFAAISTDIRASTGPISRPVKLRVGDGSFQEVRALTCALRDRKGEVEAILIVLEHRRDENDSVVL